MAHPRRGRPATAIGPLQPLECRTLLARGDLLVQFAPGLAIAAEARLLARFPLVVAERFDDGLVVARPTAKSDIVVQLQARLSRTPGVLGVEIDHALTNDAVFPSDSSFAAQWGLNNPNNVDIDAPQAWQVTTGSPKTIVAVIDSGIDTRHAEFAGRLWVNPREIAGNGKDDDHDGYVDDVNGWNFAANTNQLRDDLGHGTHVAGILAASASGGGQVAGVDWQARIMPLKFIDASGSGMVSDAVRAIQFAVQHGARVINASWGGPAYSPALANAIRYAGTKGVVFVAAAGNDSANLDVERSYPASLHLANMIAVAAVDSSGRLAGFSNYGRRSVDLAAPGVGILSTVPGGYATYSGTSMAAPFVSGVVSLLVGQHPTWSAAQLVQRVEATVKPLPSLAGRTITGGMVDAARALDPNFGKAARTVAPPAVKKVVAPSALRAKTQSPDAVAPPQGAFETMAEPPRAQMGNVARRSAADPGRYRSVRSSRFALRRLLPISGPGRGCRGCQSRQAAVPSAGPLGYDPA